MDLGNRLDQRELLFYNQALGPSEATFVAPPPFSFLGVTSRVFPRAAAKAKQD